MADWYVKEGKDSDVVLSTKACIVRNVKGYNFVPRLDDADCQSLIETIDGAVDKIQRLSYIREQEKLSFAIEVDGGVTLSNAAMLKEAGCDIMVAGSAVFKAEDIPQRVRDFKKILG